MLHFWQAGKTHQRRRLKDSNKFGFNSIMMKIVGILWIFLVLSFELEVNTKSILGRDLTSTTNPCAGKEPGSFVADPFSCDYFYYCDKTGEGSRTKCPTEMFFNANTGICDVRENVRCLDRVDEPEVSEEDIEDDKDEEVKHEEDNGGENGVCPKSDPKNVVLLASTQKCHEYFICYHGKALLRECTNGLHFNDALKTCDYPDNAHCNAAQSDWIQPQCPVKGERIFPHPKFCNYFIYCKNGYATTQQCTFYHHFDVMTRRCQWRTMARCVVDEDVQTRRLIMAGM